MALTPLTRVQQATVVALVQARRLDVVHADLARATSFLRQAEERLNELPILADDAPPVTDHVSAGQSAFSGILR